MRHPSASPGQGYHGCRTSYQLFTTLRSSKAQTGLWLILKTPSSARKPKVRSGLHPTCWTLGQSPHILPLGGGFTTGMGTLPGQEMSWGRGGEEKMGILGRKNPLQRGGHGHSVKGGRGA